MVAVENNANPKFLNLLINFTITICSSKKDIYTKLHTNTKYFFANVMSLSLIYFENYSAFLISS